jgi:dihydrodipicolinate synthase/N-acetylneuraminate lyase
MIEGIFAPIPTPFTGDEEVNYEKLGENLEKGRDRPRAST